MIELLAFGAFRRQVRTRQMSCLTHSAKDGDMNVRHSVQDWFLSIDIGTAYPDAPRMRSLA